MENTRRQLRKQVQAICSSENNSSPKQEKCLQGVVIMRKYTAAIHARVHHGCEFRLALPGVPALTSTSHRVRILELPGITTNTYWPTISEQLTSRACPWATLYWSPHCQRYCQGKIWYCQVRHTPLCLHPSCLHYPL